MAKIKYNKLVRDKIPEIIRKDGDTPVTHTACNVEYMMALKAKLQEETMEFVESGRPEELADIFEIILALLEAGGMTPDEFEMIRMKKFNSHGGFSKQIILEEVITNGG